MSLSTYGATSALGPFTKADAITPNDGADVDLQVSQDMLGLYIGLDGNLAAVPFNAPSGASPVTFVGLKAGSVLPGRFRRVYSTNTTCTGLLALR